MLAVRDFKQPFEINVELKGVMQDASVMHINNARVKSRMLHCAAAVSIGQPALTAVCVSEKTILDAHLRSSADGY